MKYQLQCSLLTPSSRQGKARSTRPSLHLSITTTHILLSLMCVVFQIRDRHRNPWLWCWYDKPLCSSKKETLGKKGIFVTYTLWELLYRMLLSRARLQKSPNWFNQVIKKRQEEKRSEWSFVNICHPSLLSVLLCLTAALRLSFDIYPTCFYLFTSHYLYFSSHAFSFLLRSIVADVGWIWISVRAAAARRIGFQ